MHSNHSTLLFIARRLQTSRKNGQQMSRPAVRIAIIGVALGVAVMLITIAIVTGFQKAVRQQIIGFTSSVQVLPYASSAQSSTASVPLDWTPEIQNTLEAIPHVTAVQRIGECDGIIKTKDSFYGIRLMGLDSTYQWSFIQSHLMAGSRLQFPDSTLSSGLVISQWVAQKLHLKVGDKVVTYFVRNRVAARKFTIQGIYKTSYQPFDKIYVLADVRQVQQLQHWTPTQYSNLSLLIDHFSKLDEVGDQVYYATANHLSEHGPSYQSNTIKQLMPSMFQWLRMLDTNAYVIISLMCLVSGFVMISGLLILILEQTSFIGTFKALGATNWKIRQLFITQASILVGKGLLWGNLIGHALLILQYYTHFIKLNSKYYYVDYAPVNLSFTNALLINVIAGVTAILLMVGPSYIITKIDPVKAIRFD